MNIYQAILLGIIQGLTEFLPVSSSGHLVIMQTLFKNFKQPGLSFDIFIHLATLFSVLVFFNKEIIKIITFKNKKWIYLIFFSCIPAGIIGVLFKDTIEFIFSNILIVGIMLIITGIFLFISDKVKNLKKSDNNITFYDAIVIGIAQAFAILPGISRSGATITTGIFRGLKRDTATKFSFLMSIPVIIGAVALSYEDFLTLSFKEVNLYFIGFFSAFLTGLISLKLLTFIIKLKNLKYFSYYCWSLGLFSIFIYLKNHGI